MNNSTESLVNDLYDNTLTIFEYYKLSQLKSKSESNSKIKNSVEYKKLLSYTRTFDLAITNMATLTNSKDNNPLTYFTLKTISQIYVKLLIAYSIFYVIARNDGTKRIGFDFEFNEGKIAVWQVAFYPNKETCYIFVIDPYLFENDCKQYKHLVIDAIFTSSAKKILHGGDSLDLPYIFNILFEKNHTLIQKFIKNMSDTRFLCEYIKITNNEGNKKCSIYDALLYFDTISQNEYDDLNKLTISMGPVQDVNWNLYNMSSYHLKYTMYDVLFLERFIKNMYKRHNNNTELNVVTQINKFCFYEKYELSNILNESKQLVDTINNYFIVNGESQIRLIELYELITNKINTNNDKNMQPLQHFLKTLEINNFKKFMVTVLKRIVYTIALELHTVYENKKSIYKTQISYLNIFDKLLKFKLTDLAIMFIEFTDKAKEIIDNL